VSLAGGGRVYGPSRAKRVAKWGILDGETSFILCTALSCNNAVVDAPRQLCSEAHSGQGGTPLHAEGKHRLLTPRINIVLYTIMGQLATTPLQFRFFLGEG
jgi:hypothetical protein